ncbi:hypothetical protein MB901379_03290 [Mycobacterium basiliense]|uniref:Uncharacterized protein n=1 Tax=Mycobacterium basiliense TaxID=2094119 RepID=A0A447GH59_9MYCO|nr:hypothetical protein MB901379_03290 [Mycobacterium basiliense]
MGAVLPRPSIVGMRACARHRSRSSALAALADGTAQPRHPLGGWGRKRFTPAESNRMRGESVGEAAFLCRLGYIY